MNIRRLARYVPHPTVSKVLIYAAIGSIAVTTLRIGNALTFGDLTEGARNLINSAASGGSQRFSSDGCVNIECTTNVESRSRIAAEGGAEYAGGGLSNAELIRLTRHLKFPQSYDAMIATFGAPQQRSQQYDYYRIPNGQYVAVEYQSRRAVGYTYR